MRPAPYANEDTFGTPEDEAVADPLSDKTIDLWNATAKKNTEIFAKVFKPVPSDKVTTWEDFDVCRILFNGLANITEIYLKEIRT